MCRQKKDQALQNKFMTEPELYIKKPDTFSDDMHELITKNNRIYIPKAL